MSLIKDEFKSPNSQSTESFLKEVSNSSNDRPSTCLWVKKLCLTKLTFSRDTQYSWNFSIILWRSYYVPLVQKQMYYRFSYPCDLYNVTICSTNFVPFWVFYCYSKVEFEVFLSIFWNWYLGCPIQMIVYLIDWILPYLISTKRWYHQRWLIVGCK